VSLLLPEAAAALPHTPTTGPTALLLAGCCCSCTAGSAGAASCQWSGSAVPPVSAANDCHSLTAQPPAAALLQLHLTCQPAA
jgi:hypothetical protein